jgi:hypothetical protein
MSGPLQPAAIYTTLRNRILSLNPSEVGIQPSEAAPNVWGVLMEIGLEEAVVTLATLVDGTTSLYYSTGGGMLGSGSYAPVAQAARGLIMEAEGRFWEMAPVEAYPLPEAGRVRFYALTYQGHYTAEASEKELGEGQHALSALFYLAHRVIGTLRQLSERQQGDKSSKDGAAKG